MNDLTPTFMGDLRLFKPIDFKIDRYTVNDKDKQCGYGTWRGNKGYFVIHVPTQFFSWHPL